MKDKYNVILPDALREIIAENRENMYPQPKTDIIDIVGGYQPVGLDANTDAAFAAFLKQSRDNNNTPPENLSHQAIIGELDRLFDYLKQAAICAR